MHRANWRHGEKRMSDRSSLLRLADLDAAQLRRIYHEHMKEDFPAAELKPLEMIEKGIEKGYYRFLGLSDGDEVIGYTGLIFCEDACLVDYLATMPERRNRGAGRDLIRCLKNDFKDTEYVIVEVETPACGSDEAERKLRQRRMNFYLRNGFRDTGMDVSVFGVRFRLLELPHGTPHDGQEILTRYMNIYRYVLPEDLFRANVIAD